MDKNANVPNQQNLNRINGIEDIPLVTSEVIKKPQVIPMIAEEKKGFLQSLGEKLNQVSNLFSFLWKEEKPLKTLRIQPNIAHFKSPRNKNNLMRTNRPFYQAVNDMEIEINRTITPEPDLMKASNSNMIRYYRNMHITKSRMMKRAEGDFPLVDCFRPKPQYIRQDLIHARKPMEPLTPARLQGNSPIRPMKEVLQEKKKIAKAKQVQKKIEAKVELRRKQQKERMRISTYFIDNLESPPHREMTESDKEEEEVIIDQPTKKVFGNDKTVLRVTTQQVKQEVIQSPQIEETQSEKFEAYRGFENIVQEKKTEEIVQKTELKKFFFAPKRIAFPMEEEDESENETIIKSETKQLNHYQNLFPTEEPQPVFKEFVEPSAFQGRRIVPSSFKFRTAELDEKPKVNIESPQNEFQFQIPLRSDSITNRKEIPVLPGADEEIKNIRVKEISAQFLSDHLSDSTNLSSRSKDTQDQILADQQYKPSFFKFQRDFRLSKF